jgi:hypothetical protein
MRDACELSIAKAQVQQPDAHASLATAEKIELHLRTKKFGFCLLFEPRFTLYESRLLISS